MPARELIGAEHVVLASSKVSITDATTTSYDFGSPNDIYVPSLAGYEQGMRLLLVFTATTAGTTSAITFVVQDADDSAGSIGTPATAVTDGTLAVGTGDGFAVIGARLQNGRPWLRVRVTSDNATDTHETAVVLIGVPAAL